MQAVIVAGICEFLGAVLLGSSVADTIKSGIAKLPTFAGTPGMLCYKHHPNSLLIADLDRYCRLADDWNGGCITHNRIVAGSCHLSGTTCLHIPFSRSVDPPVK